MGRKAKRSKYQKEKDRKRNNQRSEVEGKFGESKNRYGMNQLQTRLPQTTNAEISLIMLAVNLVQLLRKVGESTFLAGVREIYTAMPRLKDLFYCISQQELSVFPPRINHYRPLVIRNRSF